MQTRTDERIRAAFALAAQVFGFAQRTFRGFFANRGVDLAGTLAYNGLLSVVPMFLLAAAIFARFVDRPHFIAAVTRQIRQVLPSAQAQPVNQAIVSMLEEPFSGGVFGLVALLFFSTLAFRALQHALDEIFVHRRPKHHVRSLFGSIVISLGFVLAIGFASLLQALALVSLDQLPWLAEKIPRWAGAFGLFATALVLASIYLVTPLGRGKPQAALIGGAIAAVLWQGLHGVLAWYFVNVSSVNLIYGSLTGIILVLFSFELAAAIVLLAAQVTAELEKSWNAGLHWYQAP